MEAGGVLLPCTLGARGATPFKREGDGKTPRGALRLLGWYAPRPIGRPAWRITPALGWCDDAGHPAYNRLVRLPCRASHERMGRDDGKYDVVGVLDWNLRPRIRGRGSAIFFHINDETEGTAGCVALRRADMRRLLPRLGRRVRLIVQ